MTLHLPQEYRSAIKESRKQEKIDNYELMKGLHEEGEKYYTHYCV